MKKVLVLVGKVVALVGTVVAAYFTTTGQYPEATRAWSATATVLWIVSFAA